MVKFITFPLVALALGALTVAASTTAPSADENALLYKRTADGECWCKSSSVQPAHSDSESPEGGLNLAIPILSGNGSGNKDNLNGNKDNGEWRCA